MIDYRKYIQVLEILKDVKTNTPEDMAYAICDLFDTKTVATPFTYWTNIPLDLNRVTYDDRTTEQVPNRWTSTYEM